MEEISNGYYSNPQVEQLLIRLSKRLANTTGKKVYGYLKADVKAIVDEIVAELSKDENIRKLYDLSRSGNTSAGVPCKDRELASDIGKRAMTHLCSLTASMRQRKVVSGSVGSENRPWPTCLAMTAPALVLLSSHSHMQWGQLGEILGGVRIP